MVNVEVQGKAANLFTAAVIAFTAGERVAVSQIIGRSYDPHPANDAVQFGQRVQQLLNLYDWQVIHVQLNLLDSHDTSRLPRMGGPRTGPPRRRTPSGGPVLRAADAALTRQVTVPETDSLPD